MRKITIAFITCMGTVGMLGSTAGIAVAADPLSECEGLKPGVNKFHISTDPDTAGQPASLSGGALLCGSDFGPGTSDGYKSGTITMPKSVKVRCANPKHPGACTSEPDLESGRYIGDVTMTVELVMGGSPTMLPNLHTKMYVDQAPPGAFGSHPNSDCTAAAVACYQGLDDLGTATANVIVKKGSNGKYKLQIHETEPFLPGVKVYYLKIGGTYNGDPDDMHLCKYAGAVQGSSCGTDPSDWMQKNGNAGFYKCSLFPFWSWKKIMYQGKPLWFPYPAPYGYWVTTNPDFQEKPDWSSRSRAQKIAALFSKKQSCATITWS